LRKVLITFLMTITPFFSLTSNVFGQDLKSDVKKEIVCPSDFLKNPPVYFYCIYKDYHNHKYNSGIEKAQKALKEIQPLLKENPNAVIPNAVQKNARLRDPHVKSVASDLHLLLGMLYFKKASNLKDNSVEKVYKNFYEKLEKRGFDFFQISELMDLYTKKRLFPAAFTKKDKENYERLLNKMNLSEAELDRLTTETQKASEKLEKERLSYLRKAVKEFQQAVKIDPNNAIAYYQLGNLYSGILSEDTPKDSSAAEEAYYKAAILLKKQGDISGYEEVVKKLELINPRSKYLKLLQRKNRKDA